MEFSRSSLVLLLGVVAAGAYALGRETAPSGAERVLETRPEPAHEQGADPAEMEQGDLPPDHPPVPTARPAPGLQDPAPDDEGAAIRWSVPAGWRTAPNPSSMRIATYAVPHAPTDTVDADVSVTRAGGDVSSNIQRWGSQFEGAAEPKLRSQTVHGLEVTVVEIEGTYASAMSADTTPRPGWALLGAIVKTGGHPYFFKITGPAATVHGARGAFTTLIESIRPNE